MKAGFVWLYCDCKDNEKTFLVGWGGGYKFVCVCWNPCHYKAVSQLATVHLLGSSLFENNYNSNFSKPAVYTQGNFLDPEGFNKQYPKLQVLADLFSLKLEQCWKTESDMEHPLLKPWPLGYGQGWSPGGLHQPSQECIWLVSAHTVVVKYF